MRQTNREETDVKITLSRDDLLRLSDDDFLKLTEWVLVENKRRGNFLITLEPKRRDGIS